MESKLRSLTKTITWRATATATTFLIAYLVTGNIILSALIGGIEGTTKMLIYYGHER
ncbi:MAG: DUF2061 domain-containing protein, partial [Candidatus Bathyarchaeia archaeon]